MVKTCIFLLLMIGAEAHGEYLSHPPVRPLPNPSKRPLGRGPAYFVDAKRGNDANPGSKEKPWKTVQHGLTRLKLGETLYLRGGIYYENLGCKLNGHPEAPVTVRSYPGELAVLDGGVPEFTDDPAGSWLPVEGGAEGEFVSKKSYPDVTRVAAIFADSMIPLQSYRNLIDLRSDDPFWNLKHKADTQTGMYCGPGVWFNSETNRIHVRLRHYKIPQLQPFEWYRGETDPRKLPLIVGFRTKRTLRIENSKHVRFQDLVIRAGGHPCISVSNCEDIELDNVVVYSVFTSFTVSGTKRLRIFNSAFRGMGSPWSYRGHHKYRSMDKFLFVAAPGDGSNEDFEFAWSEFTDDHDGLHLGGIQGLKFHHNLVDYFNDDGVFLTARNANCGDLHFYQNKFSRCLTTFAFGYGHQSYHGHGRGVYIYRNIIELLRYVHYHSQKEDSPPDNDSPGRVSGDHGSPTWEPMTFYHNTFFARKKGWRGYCLGLGYHMLRTKRRVFNNIFVVTDEMPLSLAPSEGLDFLADGNLFWSVKDGPKFEGDFFEKFRSSKSFAASRKLYAPGWEAAAMFADPKFMKANTDWQSPKDFRLQPGSPAIDSGVNIPVYSPDPMRETDKGKPDIGALPLGAPPFKYGRQDR